MADAMSDKFGFPVVDVWTHVNLLQLAVDEIRQKDLNLIGVRFVK